MRQSFLRASQGPFSCDPADSRHFGSVLWPARAPCTFSPGSWEIRSGAGHPQPLPPPITQSSRASSSGSRHSTMTAPPAWSGTARWWLPPRRSGLLEKGGRRVFLRTPCDSASNERASDLQSWTQWRFIRNLFSSSTACSRRTSPSLPADCGRFLSRGAPVDEGAHPHGRDDPRRTARVRRRGSCAGRSRARPRRATRARRATGCAGAWSRSSGGERTCSGVSEQTPPPSRPE